MQCHTPLLNSKAQIARRLMGPWTIWHRRRIHRSQYGPYPATKSATAREKILVHNPANGEFLCSVSSASLRDVSEAINEAQVVFQSGIWSRSSPIHRSNVLSTLAASLRTRIPEFAQLETLQTGRPIREMKAQLTRLPEWLEYYAALLRSQTGIVAPVQGKLLNYIQRIPLGVVAQITPFNHPMLIAIKKIAPALAAGNSVIIKPSELAPITVLEFAKMAFEAGVPSGVLSVLPGYGKTTGSEIVKNPLIRKVDITAGTPTGRALGAIAGANLAAFTAELGGKTPIVVFNDADMQSAVNGVAFASFVASGQTCVSGARIIIQDEIYDQFITRFLAKVKQIENGMGDPSNPASTMGTIVSGKHLQRIEGMVSRTSGTVLAGGRRMVGISKLDGHDFSRGSFFPPTVIIDVPREEELWREEVFGPVVVIQRFSTEDEGVLIANDCKYGLGAGVWTSDLSRAHRVASRIEAGLCWVNTHHRNDPSSPWGGMKESGIGRENGLEALEAYTQTKSTIVNIASAEETREADDWFSDGAVEKRYG